LALVAEHAALSDIGLQRSANEDAFVAAPPLFAVADGMGGAQAGEVASRTAIEVLGRTLESGGSLADAAQEANRQVFALAEDDPSRAGMGTTLTALRLLEGNERAELVHVGDSRAYLLRDGFLEQLTADHSLVGEMVREGKLTADEAFSHPARSILSRVLGTEPRVKFDRRKIDLRAGDVLLLCSDGLSSAVTDATIERRLQMAAPRDAARRLVVEAKNQGGHDNITVVVLRFTHAEAAERGDEERTAVLPTAVSDSAETAATAPLPPPVEAAAGDEAPAVEVVAAGAEAPPHRGLSRRRLWLLVAGLVVAALLVGLAVTLNVSYYVGVDDGYVSVFQGLPYGIGGLDLSRVYLRTNTHATTVASEDQRLLTQRTVTSKDDALRTVESLRTATPTPSPGTTLTPSSSPSPTGRSSATPSAKGTP
jgi:serine/threonine protein phosphatase PrpC